MKRAIALTFLCIWLMNPAPVRAAGSIEAVRAAVFEWAEAWENRDIDRYMAFYDTDFSAEGLDRREWRAKKAGVFQKNDRIRVQIDDLWVWIEGKTAVATFVQRYRDRFILDIGEKTLVFVKAQRSWRIVSEDWKPMAPPVAGPGEKAPPEPVGKRQRGGEPDGSATPAKHSSAENTVVENLEFDTQGAWEKVFIRLNRFAVPVVRTLEGKKPRVVIDVGNVSRWDGDYRIPVNGKVIRRIRTYLHRDVAKLRIVLDLNPAQDYFIRQAFIKTDNTYCIEVR